MIKNYLIIASIFICSLNSVFSDEKLNFDFDYACFKSGSSKIYLEFYYAFSQDELKLIKEDGGFKSGGKILLDIYSNAAGKNVVMKEFNIPFYTNDTSSHDIHSKLTGQINFLLDTGSYKFKIKACDLHDSSNCYNTTVDIVLKPIPSDLINSSCIELATNISRSSDENSVFYKNTLEVTPNPSKLFGNNLSKVFFYIELYNLKSNLLTENYTVDISITDNDGKEFKHDKRQYSRKSESKVEYGAIDISDVPSGKYIFLIKINNDNNAEVLKTIKEFYIFNSNLPVVNENLTDIDIKFISSSYSKMDEKQVEDEYNKSIYIMTEKSREQYQKLKDTDSKRKFMFLFWNALDPNPATPESEFRKDYFDRIDFSIKNFGSDFKEGWKTDRGRVYCIYGKYDEIERHSYEGATRAYEIWSYNSLQGGVIFVFIDESSGYGNYILVHSNARNEINNDNWRERLGIK